MDRFESSSFFQSLFLLLAASLIVGAVSGDVLAQYSQRAGSNQTSARAFKKSFRQVSAQKTATNQPAASTGDIIDPAVDDAYAWDDYLGDTNCSSGCDISCGNSVGCRSRCGPSIYAGFEAVQVKPRFENNVAFTVRDGDGNTVANFTDTEFAYKTEFTPRAFVGWRHQDGVGLRVTWWQFDNSAAAASASPPDNGVGIITHPPFGNIDISTADPTNVFSAASSLNTYAIDLEATKQAKFSSWDLGIGCGVRYAYTEQTYLAQVRDADDQLRGQIDYSHSLEGFGPTISLEAYRPIVSNVSIFGKARGSVLFGDGDSSLNAGENLDFTNPFTTTKTTNRNDLLSIAEIQLGFRWLATQKRGQTLRPFLSVALEGQVWNGAGNATSEEGTLGFFGLNSGAGVQW